MIDELTKKLVEDARDILEGKNPKEKEEEKELDKVSGKELSKKFKDRDDKDIDNDGDTDDSDEYLHKRRQTIQKAMDTEGNKFTGALMSAKKNGKDHFMVSGKKYMVKEVSQCMSAQKMKELEADYMKSQKELEAGASYK